MGLFARNAEVQETFARVLARPRHLRRDDELPYLLGALRNAQRLRTLQRRPRTVELPADDREALRSHHATPETVLELRELLATVATLR